MPMSACSAPQGEAGGNRACLLGDCATSRPRARSKYLPVRLRRLLPRNRVSAISLTQPSQHHRCPAMRACALALTRSSHLVEPVTDAAKACRMPVRKSPDQLLSPEADRRARRTVGRRRRDVPRPSRLSRSASELYASPYRAIARRGNFGPGRWRPLSSR